MANIDVGDIPAQKIQDIGESFQAEANTLEEPLPFPLLEIPPISASEIPQKAPKKDTTKERQPRLRRQRMSDVPDDYTPPPDLIEGVMRKGRATMLFAPPASMKTFFQFQLAYAMAAGKHPFEGAAHMKNINHGKRVRTLYVSSELTLEDLQERHGSEWKRDIIDKEGRTESDGTPLEWLVLLPVARSPEPDKETTAVFEDIRYELEEAQNSGYPFEAISIDNVTTLWPECLSDNALAANVANKFKALCEGDDNGQNQLALLFSMHLNKLGGLKYEEVNVGMMKGNAMFDIVGQRCIGMNRSVVKEDSAYLVETKSRSTSQADQYTRQKCATFKVYPLKPELGKKSPVWMRFDGVSTEAAERGKEASPKDVADNWTKNYLTANPDVGYKKFCEVFGEKFEKNDPPSETKFRDTKKLCKRATGAMIEDNKKFYSELGQQ